MRRQTAILRRMSRISPSNEPGRLCHFAANPCRRPGASEEISPFDVGHTVGLFDGSETLGYLELQPPMRASPVVVLHIDPKDAIEMPARARRWWSPSSVRHARASERPAADQTLRRLRRPPVSTKMSSSRKGVTPDPGRRCT